MYSKTSGNAVKELFRQIETIKRNLSNQLSNLKDDSTRSEKYKQAEKNALIETAKKELLSLTLEADAKVQALKDADKPLVFDYSDPKLAAAVSFITTAGASMPRDAAEQIINDFKESPVTLGYLVSIFEKTGLTEYAVNAAEYVKIGARNANFPNRLGDTLYYALTSDPESKVDFSEVEHDLDALTEA